MKPKRGQKACKSCDQVNGARAYTCKKCGEPFVMKNGRIRYGKKPIEDWTTLKEGDCFINSDFSDFLERVSIEGADFFYLGEGADLIAQTFNDGGMLSKEALRQYHVAVRKPVMTQFRDTQVYSNPAPSVGGTLIIFLLRLLEEGRIQNLELSNLLQAMEVTNIARKEICKNPNDEYQINQLLDKDKLT